MEIFSGHYCWFGTDVSNRFRTYIAAPVSVYALVIIADFACRWYFQRRDICDPNETISCLRPGNGDSEYSVFSHGTDPA